MCLYVCTEVYGLDIDNIFFLFLLGICQDTNLKLLVLLHLFCIAWQYVLHCLQFELTYNTFCLFQCILPVTKYSHKWGDVIGDQFSFQQLFFVF